MDYGSDAFFMWFLGGTLVIYFLLRIAGFNHLKAAQIKELISLGLFVVAIVFLISITIYYS